MRYSAYLATVMFLACSHSGFAADQNSYTAQYERNVGNVPACDLVISGANDSNWEHINDSSYRVICVRPGDYSSRATITLSSSGTPGNERWLRYYNDSNTSHPINQPNSERVILRQLVLDGANYWIVNRLTVDSAQQSVNNVEIRSNSTNNVLNQMLIQNGGRDFEGQVLIFGNSNTVQYTVSRFTRRATNVDTDCFQLDGASNTRLVNNEAYGCNSKAFYIAPAGAPGSVIENNDFYVSPQQFTDCRGNFTPNNPDSPCAAQKALMSIKAGGTASKPVLIIHNRMWNSRATDLNVCCYSGSQGQTVSISSGSDTPGQGPYAQYVLFQNNIVTDGQLAVQTPRTGPQYNSIIGNIFYNIKPYNSSWPSSALDIFALNKTEIYLNTIINTNRWANFGGSDQDVQCNVVINGGSYGGSAGSGTVVNLNTFYAASKYATSGASVAWASDNADDAKDDDFCFARKLITGPEQYCILRARPTTGSPHYRGCATILGSRSGIGINDSPIF